MIHSDRVYLLRAAVIGFSVSIRHWRSWFKKACEAGEFCEKDPLSALHTSFEHCVLLGLFGSIGSGFSLTAAFVSPLPYIAVMVVDDLAAICFLTGKAVNASHVRIQWTCDTLTRRTKSGDVDGWAGL